MTAEKKRSEQPLVDEFYVGQCGMEEATMDIKRRLKSKGGNFGFVR